VRSFTGSGLNDGAVAGVSSGARYTLDGDAGVEARIASDQAVVAEAVEALLQPPGFRALVLMGGYGRGEGGYVMREGGPAPYNDYDYFVVVRGLDRGRRRALSRELAAAAARLEQAVGVEVDFALLRDEGLPRAEYSLMNAEMLWGHRVIAGDARVLEAMPPMPLDGLPAGEFTRLLLNRGALLLLNQQRLLAPAGAGLDHEVFFKYLFKAVLACGDAHLARQGSYDPSYVCKRQRLCAGSSAASGALAEFYPLAFEHKFHPDYQRFAAEDPARWQARVTDLWLDTLAAFEQWRCRRALDDWQAYCAPGWPKGQGGRSWGGLRNAAVTLRDFGPAELVRRPRWSLRYPRERLIAVLPVLLAHPGSAPGPAAAAALALPASVPWEPAAAAFLRLWQRFA